MSSPTVILCVNDEPNILMLRQVLLSIAGYKVLTATDGESAIRLLALDNVDLVIADYLLPGRTGGQLASAMKQLKPGVPIILYTGSEHVTDAIDADLVLERGITPLEFLGAIAKLAEGRQKTKPTKA